MLLRAGTSAKKREWKAIHCDDGERRSHAHNASRGNLSSFNCPVESTQQKTSFCASRRYNTRIEAILRQSIVLLYILQSYNVIPFKPVNWLAGLLSAYLIERDGLLQLPAFVFM